MIRTHIPVSDRHGRYIRPLFLCLFAVFTILAGCTSGTDTADAVSGEIVIGLTDAEGDLASYTVEVTSLTLIRQDGTVVETLPLNTHVDFAQYTELTEFLTAATIPAGTYIRAGMVLDYSNADIRVEDPSGSIVPVTDIRDIGGNPVQTLELSVQFEERDRLRIAPGIPAHLTLDFDLEASNRVDFSVTDPVLTVAPFLAADLLLEDPKPHRLRGPLASVDVDDDRFNLVIRPFRHAFAGDGRRFGTLDVHVNADTYYEIDGITYQGNPGLEELDTRSQFTAVIAIGEIEGTAGQREFVAAQVYAGSSVPNGEHDVASGHVIARSGNTLQLRGATLLRTDGSVIFNETLSVELAHGTIVTRQLSTDSHDISEISVGQRITAFGSANGDLLTGFSLDASSGKVRIRLATVTGSTVQQDSPLALDLQRIGRLSAAQFDFSGTGVDAPNDADADFYEINTGSLDLSGIGLNDPVKVRGFVRAFGMAPEDFDARTLIKVAATKARMTVNWNPAIGAAIAEITPDHILLDLGGAGRFHHVVRAGVRTDLALLTGSPVLVPDSSGSGAYTIRQHETLQLFTNYTDFSEALSDYLDAAAEVRLVKATGQFDDDDVTMMMRNIRVVLD